jgi:hypothetical protein
MTDYHRRGRHRFSGPALPKIAQLDWGDWEAI